RRSTIAPAHAAGAPLCRARKGDGAAIGHEKPDEQARRRRLAASRFADDAERLAAPHLERNIVNRLNRCDLALEQPAADGEIALEIAHFEQRVDAHDQPLTSAHPWRCAARRSSN